MHILTFCRRAGTALLAGAALLGLLLPAGAAGQETPSVPAAGGAPALQTEGRPADGDRVRGEREERYRAYAARCPDKSWDRVVLEVDIGLDRPFYEGVEPAEDPDSIAVLVNKYHALPEDYVPQLEALGSRYGTGSLRPEAAQAFWDMAEAARKDGVALRSVSAYRSYQTQSAIYQRYLKNSGQTATDTFSARPGHSEHQTGLALDINTASRGAHFEGTPAYAWLVEQCAEYGFILRYPQGKEEITGYCFEPWHYRYVGVEAARACMEAGLTYEEHLALRPVDGEEEEALLPQDSQTLQERPGPIPGLPLI